MVFLGFGKDQVLVLEKTKNTSLEKLSLWFWKRPRLSLERLILAVLKVWKSPAWQMDLVQRAQRTKRAGPLEVALPMPSAAICAKKSNGVHWRVRTLAALLA